MGIIKSTGSTPPYTTGLVIFQERVNHRLPAAPPKPGVVLVHRRHAGFATLHPAGCRDHNETEWIRVLGICWSIIPSPDKGRQTRAISRRSISGSYDIPSLFY